MVGAYPVLGKTLLPLLRSRIWTVRGREHLPTAGGYILVANHQSWIDSALVAAALYRALRKPLRFVAQSRKWKMFGGLPITDADRSRVLDTALDQLMTGHPVVIFPEGNSNREQELRSGKTGAARLALRSGLPVIPIGIRGTRGVRAWGAALWFFSIVRPCHVIIGEPMVFPKTNLHGDDTELLQRTTETIMQQISTMSGKPLPGQGPTLEHRGPFWFFIWRLARPFVQWRVRIHGAEHLPMQGPFIVAGNHVSYFDPPALSMAVFHVTGLQPMFLAKAGVVSGLSKVFGRKGVRALGMIALNEVNKAQALEPAIDHLHRGGVIGIFPEGGRNMPHKNPNWKTELMKGKTGTARLAIATGVAVIPVGVDVPHGIGIWESIGKALLPWLFMHVTFGAPVTFSHVPENIEVATKDEMVLMTTTIMRDIARLAKMSYPY